MRVTMAQVASLSGVSRSSASLVLNNKDALLRPETRRKVLEAAAELGYRPNASARAVSMGRFNCVALLQSDDTFRSYLGTHAMGGIQAALEKADLHLVLATLSDRKLTDEAYVPKILRSWMADGLLINYIVAIPESLVELIEKYRIPSIWLNAKRPCNAVYPDDVLGGRIATERLLRLGHRRVAYVDYTFPERSTFPVHYSTVDRHAGYSAAMAEAGLAPRFIRPPQHLTPTEAVEFSASWLAAADAPTAVVAYNPSAAKPILTAVLSRARGVVPRNFGMVTFDPALSDDTGVAIDTVVLPEREMGRTAVELLLRRIDNPELRIPGIAVPQRLMEGKSGQFFE
jgi:LacI family transcriptional regulator